MAANRKRIKSDMGWNTPDRITVRGMDLPSQLLGHVALGDVAFLELTGRLPTAQESRLFNAMVVALVEHGMTPSALATRFAYLGAPESLQAAVAAGLCGLGTVFVGTMEGMARLLYAALPQGQISEDLPRLAAEVVAGFRSRGEAIPGIGHPTHKPVDPRAPRLFEIAAECGLSGQYVQLAQRVSQEAERVYGKVLPLNATGAIGALCCEFGFDWRICRGLGVMGRAIGLVGHILEEIREPMAKELWMRVEEEATEHARPPHRTSPSP